MKIEKNRAWKALGIGLVLILPILYMYVPGGGSESTLNNVVASMLVFPAMILMMPVLLLKPFVSDPDTYILGAYFFSIPFLSFALYSLGAYGVLSLIARKK